MSLDYSLLIAGVTRDDVRVPEAEELSVWVREPTHVRVEITEEEFGFTPSVQVYIVANSDADVIVRRTALLRACMAALETAPADAVLLFNGETPIFLRRDGRFLLNPIERFWTESELGALNLPYEFRPFPDVSA